MNNVSPLRYPGGKSKISSFVKIVINKAAINGTYIEPFAGGAGVALQLLFDNAVDNIVINDYDKAIYSFWRAIKQDGKKLLDLIEKTPVTVDEWRKQKQIYLTANCYSVELAFATFYLNRTNRSGILTAGPIGGFEQCGNYKIDVRYNKKSLIRKIEKIMEYKKNIYVYNKDICKFVVNIIPKFENNAFVYFDPPYYNKGQQLYKNFLMHSDHEKIADLIKKLNCPWIVSYDDVSDIEEIYAGYLIKKFSVNYSAANSGKSMELMIFGNRELCPDNIELKKANIELI